MCIVYIKLITKILKKTRFTYFQKTEEKKLLLTKFAHQATLVWIFSVVTPPLPLSQEFYKMKRKT